MNKGKIDGDVKRHANMLARSYKDPVEKHEPKITNRYSLDFGDASGKFLSRYGRMAFDKRKSEYDNLQTQVKDEKNHFEKNKRFILNDRYNNTNRWDQNVNSREELIGTYKLDKKVLYSPDASLRTLKHAKTVISLHNTRKFKIPKRQNEVFKLEKGYVE